MNFRSPPDRSESAATVPKSSSTAPLVLTERQGAVGVVRLNRPDALNALCTPLMRALDTALRELDAETGIGAIVLTGSDRAFAAGADIAEMKDRTVVDLLDERFITADWETVTRLRKPVIAAVAGHALGGGFELALMCDLMIADETARFALPETRLGTIPGAGGTQRLTRIVGKALAMDMILTGRALSAHEALAVGLVSRVVPAGEFAVAAVDLAARIAKHSRPAICLAKEAVNKAYETHLAEGVHLERRLFYTTFATEDRKEGMAAFVEKRQPQFTHR
jgi:enoyl-CoA hydratase